MLPAFELPAQPVFTLYPHQRLLPAKVRLLIDYLVERLADDAAPLLSARVKTLKQAAQGITPRRRAVRA